ncbi:MAG: hypothetical protein ACUVTR_00425 [Dehalococcoidia bacterium]
MADHFHVIADSNRRMDEARRIEQDVHWKRKVRIPKRIFLLILNLKCADDNELIRWQTP